MVHVSNEQSRLSVAISISRVERYSSQRWLAIRNSSHGDVEGLLANGNDRSSRTSQRERERERERERDASSISQSSRIKRGIPVSLAERTMTQERGRIPNEPFSLMTHDQGLFVLHLHVY